MCATDPNISKENPDKKDAYMYLIDGYKRLNIKDTTWWRYEDESVWHVLFENEKTENYYHVNWGFSGEGNGYFSIYLLRPSQPYELEDKDKPSDIDRNYIKDKVYISIRKR